MRIARPANLLLTLTMALLVGVGAGVVGAAATDLGPWPGVIAGAGAALLGLRRPLRRWRLARRPWPAEAERWLCEHVRFYRDLDEAGRARFRRDVRFILAEHTFEGVDGVEVTDTARLAVAAGAALMLHGRPDWEIPGRRTFLFYPDVFDADYHDTDDAEFDGMAHAQGPVILSLPAVFEGWAHPGDGSNVVLHELAHLFDFSTHYADGVPSLMAGSSADAWESLVRREMKKVRAGRSLLRRYAAHDPAEFFAVAVEVFFERPHALSARHPELYRALCALFYLDPRTPGTPPDGEKELPSDGERMHPRHPRRTGPNRE